MTVIDQMGRSVELKEPPKRIVSLVPSQTEFLFDLGLDEEVIGVTKFCVHPAEWRKKKTRVGGTKNVKVSRVTELKPDLIIGNKEENDQSNICELQNIAPVWMSDIETLDDAYEMMLQIGALVGKEDKAMRMVEDIKLLFQRLIPVKQKQNVLYFIWKDPWMVAGPQTFIGHLLDLCGLENQALESRYPMVELDRVAECDLIFLSSEPYPFKAKHIVELKSKFPRAQITRVDGEMFSWYGSRLLKTPEYIQDLLTSIESNCSERRI